MKLKAALFLFSLMFFAGPVSAYRAVTAPLTPDAVNERLLPLGAAAVDGVSAKKAVAVELAPGEKVYNTFCSACHNAGIAGAPKLGDKGGWRARIKKGKETLYTHAIKGFKAMPAMGTCASCSEDDIRETVDFMLSKNG